MCNRLILVSLGLLLPFSSTRTSAMNGNGDLAIENRTQAYNGSDTKRIPEEIYEYLGSLPKEETAKDLIVSPSGKKNCDDTEYLYWQLQHLKIYQPDAPIPNGRSTFLMFEYCGTEEICFKILRLTEVKGKIESESWIYYEERSICNGIWNWLLFCVVLIAGIITFVSQVCYSFLAIKNFCKWTL